MNFLKWNDQRVINIRNQYDQQVNQLRNTYDKRVSGDLCSIYGQQMGVLRLNEKDNKIRELEASELALKKEFQEAKDNVFKMLNIQYGILFKENGVMKEEIIKLKQMVEDVTKEKNSTKEDTKDADETMESPP
uniref:Uncharacterized protein n=1 Tax=Panagrolaimus sp. ES5 TaxID=591445 RepID=A0AC34G6V3_9BILA